MTKTNWQLKDMAGNLTIVKLFTAGVVFLSCQAAFSAPSCNWGLIQGPIDDAADEIRLLSRAKGNDEIRVSRELLRLRRAVRDMDLPTCLTAARGAYIEWIDAEMILDRQMRGNDLQSLRTANDRVSRARDVLLGERRRIDGR